MKERMRKIPESVRDVLLTVLIFLTAFVLCRILSRIDNDNNPFAAQIFTLAVVLISYFTRSYYPGIICSIFGVICVNVFFTMPFYHFNLSGLGYPTTFVVMLTVSLMVSTLTTRARREEIMRFEAETERIRGGLLRAISHDLRTPLTGMIGSSSALLDRDDLSDEQRRTLADNIHSDALWLLRLTENILSVTRSQEGVAIRKKDEAVEEVLSSAILKFRRNTGSELPVMVQGNDRLVIVPMDSLLMEQVFLNLLENVSRHAYDASWIKINISSDASFARILVEDNGCGMSRSTEQSKLNTDCGTGIGLMVCRSIISAHGGKITIEESNHGTQVLITLPKEGGADDKR